MTATITGEVNRPGKIALPAGGNLDDPTTRKKIIEQALDSDKVKTRRAEGGWLTYSLINDKPYTGWVKEMSYGGYILRPYIEGKLHGPVAAWYKTGQKRYETTYVENRAQGRSTGWFKNGQEEYVTHWVKGEKHGPETKGDAGGNLVSETKLENGKMEGLEIHWHKNGQKRRETNYKDDKRHGRMTTWDDNGQKEKESIHKDGLLHGQRTEWHGNGQKRLESQWKEGKRHGIETGWYENGQKRIEYLYREGLLISASSWKPDGAQCPDTNLKNGNGIVIEYDDRGGSKKTSYLNSKKDGQVRALLQGVDLTGIYHLTSSPNKAFVVGTTYESKSWIKVWDTKEKKLLHEFRVPGKAHAVAFTPDSATLITADATGNLGAETTIRAWDRAKGKERKLGTIAGGKIADHCFSPDGSQWATLTLLGAWDHPSSAVQINVWPVAGKGKPVSIDISHPLGWVEMRPPVEGWDDKIWHVVPMHVRFSPDGKQLICETEAGLRTIYDSRTGSMLQHANVSSVGMFESVLMIALHQAPDDAKSLTLDITPNEISIEFQRAADGWWREKQKTKLSFQVHGEYFVSLIKGVEKKEHIMMGLGLKDGTKLAELSSFNHPLGVIKINRDKAGLKFRFEEVKDGTASGKTLQTFEVRYQNKPNNAAPPNPLPAE